MNLDSIEDLIEFAESKRNDIQQKSVQVLLNLTKDDAGISSLLLSSKDVVQPLIKIIAMENEVSLTATKALVNLTTNVRARKDLVDKIKTWSTLSNVFSVTMKKYAESPTTEHIELFSCLLKLTNNLTVEANGACRLLSGKYESYSLEINNYSLAGQEIFVLYEFGLKHFEDNDILLLITRVLVNITSISQGRKWILGLENYSKENVLLFRKVVTFLLSNKVDLALLSAKIVRNCLFEVTNHPEILSKFNEYFDVYLSGKDASTSDRLPFFLVFNLIGISTADDAYFSEIESDRRDVIEGFPAFMKKRIENAGEFVVVASAELRRALIDCLYLLTGSTEGRKELKACKVYEILKVYHIDEEEDDISNIVFEVVERLLVEDEEAEKQDIMNALNENETYSRIKDRKEELLFAID